MPPGAKIVSGGTVGTASPANGTSEASTTLKVAKQLEKTLKEEGASVVMTHTGSKCKLNNIQRCQLAEEAGAELSIRIHANGSDNTSTHGIEVLVPGKKYCSRKLMKKSRRAGKKVSKALAKATGAKNRGVISWNDLVGFHWASNPSILVEMGYMSNPREDKQLQKTPARKNW